MKINTFKQIKRIKVSTKIIIIIFAIFSMIYFYLMWFGNTVSPKFVHIAELNLNRYIEQIASDFKIYSLGKNNSDDLLIVKENVKGEIVSIDYDLEKIYEISSHFTNVIQDSLASASTIEAVPYLDKKLVSNNQSGILLSIPMGIVSNNVFLNNIGPKIPIYVHFIETVYTQIKTRVTDYGVNNALLDVYLKIKISYEIVTPVTGESRQLEYDLLIDSKVIQGIVPNWYGKTFESNSAFFEVSFP